MQVTLIDEEAESQQGTKFALFRNQNQASDNVPAPGLVASNVGKKADALSPFRLLNRHAMTGNFCVQIMLEPERSSTGGHGIRKTARKLV
jgi:hypothetical protein